MSLGLIIFTAAGFAFGYFMGKNTDPKASRSARVGSRLIYGGVGAAIVLLGFTLSGGPLQAADYSENIVKISGRPALDTFLSEHQSQPILVDFSASWCPPCKQIIPDLNHVADEGFSVAVVDVDEQPRLAAEYQVEMLPTLIIMRDGREIHRTFGYHTAAELRTLLENSTAPGTT